MRHAEDTRTLREAIRQQVSTEQVARRYTDLEPFGAEGWHHGPCPLGDHGGETPFYIEPDGGWHCYECDRGGDVVDLEHFCGGHDDPLDAMRALAGRYGAELPGERNGHAPTAAVGRLLSEVVAEQVWWLWRGRIPLGKVTLLDGDPDNGKSAVTTDWTARVTVGRPWPDGTPCEKGGVVLLNAEDGLADTIKPRLDAAGGDACKVLALTTVPDGDSERMLSIPEDLDTIERGIERVSAKLGVVDPLMAFLSGDVNSHRDQDVRRALAPLAKLAEQTGAAVVVVRHLNKSGGGNPLYRGGGSIGIVGAARSALLVAKHPEDEHRRVLARAKGNLAKPVPSLTFVLTEAPNGAVRVEWKGTTSHTADALLTAPADPEERSALDDAMEFLRDALKDAPVWNAQVKKDARKAGISGATLRRAKAALGVRSVKEADGSWSWVLPQQEEEGVQRAQYEQEGCQTPQDEHLQHLPIDKRFSDGKDGQHAQHAQRTGDRCIHDVAGGCWLCNGDKGGAS